jgi:galactoside O-acetyltransferase
LDWADLFLCLCFSGPTLFVWDRRISHKTCGVTLSDHCGLSPGVAVFSASDDFSGAALTGPTIPDRFRRVHGGPVVLGRHVIVGARSVILPSVRIGDGAAIGSLSLVNRDLRGFAVYAGVPVRRLRARSRKLLALEEMLRAEEASAETRRRR